MVSEHREAECNAGSIWGTPRRLFSDSLFGPLADDETCLGTDWRLLKEREAKQTFIGKPRTALVDPNRSFREVSDDRES